MYIEYIDISTTAIMNITIAFVALIGAVLVVGFVVNVYDEQGMRQDTEFYPVVSDMNREPLCDDVGDWCFQNNEQEVLAKIWEDHAPEDDWQNNMW